MWKLTRFDALISFEAKRVIVTKKKNYGFLKILQKKGNCYADIFCKLANYWAFSAVEGDLDKVEAQHLNPTGIKDEKKTQQIIRCLIITPKKRPVKSRKNVKVGKKRFPPTCAPALNSFGGEGQKDIKKPIFVQVLPHNRFLVR